MYFPEFQQENFPTVEEKFKKKNETSVSKIRTFFWQKGETINQLLINTAKIS